MILLYITIALFVAYTALIFYYWKAWSEIPGYIASSTAYTTTVSIIIPARNEEENIGRLLSALQDQAYPKEMVQIIVIDDHSTDNTAAIVKKFAGVTLLRLTEDDLNSYKKKAVETGIATATGELIVCTDADCRCGKNWLPTLVSFYEKEDPVFIAAPVAIECNAKLVQVFQAYDFAVLQGITGASVHKNIHTMCNGANMAYERKVFYEVNGFAGIDNIASGDDMLLMYKIWSRHPERVRYLKSKDAMVYTQPVKTWKEFFSQRIRWASKASKYNDKRLLPVLMIVYLFNLSFLALLIAGFWNYQYWLYVTGLWFAKTLIEFPFVRSVSHFFDKAYLMKYFFFLQPLHILYTIVSGLFGQLGMYEWKGRKVK
jgi:poly-beta-1,6-N-acetyl-D-glucosamine synthase